MATDLQAQLIEATKAGDDPLARHLLYLGADIHTGDAHANIPHDAPLVWALRNNDFRLIHTLIQFNADCSIIFTQALSDAAHNGDINACKALLSHNARVDKTLIHNTANEQIKVLLQAKAEKL